jgi:hypothetical protein
MKTRLYPIMAVSALCLATAALAVALWSSVRAQDAAPEAALAIPTTLNYQGYLREPDGSLTTGTYDITASIYDVATGGSPLYTTTLTGVTVRDGLFDIVLGDDPALPSSVFANAPLYIGVKLNGGDELIPRQRLHAVPWAFQASTLINNAAAQTIKGLTSNGKVTVNGKTTMNGDATVTGDATVAGDATVIGDATISGNVVITGTLSHPGETFVGPHFINTVPVYTIVKAICGPLDWTSYDASDYIPADATAVILQANVAKAGPDGDPWDNSALIDIRPDSSSTGKEYTLLRGASASDGDSVAWGNQGIFPVTNGTFEYRISGAFYGCYIDLIGYFK